ncbi:twin-arginine translocation signal domain-containing protein [Sinorhizobium fredii]|uniref:twin-arginine translocation signal domain-containing protein n=1 Tax=Rhizobium fredii TaxID=380 RepID=UPI003D7CC325
MVQLSAGQESTTKSSQARHRQPCWSRTRAALNRGLAQNRRSFLTRAAAAGAVGFLGRTAGSLKTTRMPSPRMARNTRLVATGLFRTKVNPSARNNAAATYQAAIAIENVRLFQEVASKRALKVFGRRSVVISGGRILSHFRLGSHGPATRAG